MASFLPTACAPTTIVSTLATSNPLFPKTPELTTPKGQTYPLTKPKISCNATKNAGHGPNKSKAKSIVQVIISWTEEICSLV